MLFALFYFAILSKLKAIFATLEATRINVFVSTVINGNCFMREEIKSKIKCKPKSTTEGEPKIYERK